MKLIISKETLLEQLNRVVGAIEKKNTSDILENVLIQATPDTLKLVGTDQKIELSSSVEIQPEIPGQITAPARKLFDICKALPDGCFITIELDEQNSLHVKNQRSHFKLATLPAEAYPLLDDIPISQEVTLTEKSFKHLIEKVSFSMANQDVRYFLNGMLLDFQGTNLFAVATDGHRLAISKYTDSHDYDKEFYEKIIIPRKSVLELSRLLDSNSQLPLTLQTSENHIRIKKDNFRFTSKLIDGKYPDYQTAIPVKTNHTIILDREQFRDTLLRVAILSNEKFRSIHILLNDNTMFLHSNNPENETAEEEIDITYTGDLFETGFNVTYLLDAVNHLEGKEIKLELTTPDASAILYSDDNTGTRYIIMPVRM